MAYRRGMTLLHDTTCSTQSSLIAFSRGCNISMSSSGMDHSDVERLVHGSADEIHVMVMSDFCSKRYWST